MPHTAADHAAAISAVDTLKYNAMAAIYKNTEAENKRLLAAVAERDIIIAATLQREHQANTNHAESTGNYHDSMKAYIKLQNEYEKECGALRKDVLALTAQNNALAAERDELKEEVATSM